jgi:hypothetical protein
MTSERMTPERLDEIKCACTENDVCTVDVLDLLDEVERLSAAQRWIPVEERLPEDGEKVIISDHGVRCIKWGVDLGFRPTHWRSLPAAPIGRREE